MADRRLDGGADVYYMGTGDSAALRADTGAQLRYLGVSRGDARP